MTANYSSGSVGGLHPDDVRDSRFASSRELWSYRELFFFLAWRDIKVRYKQSALGILWAILQPFCTMVIFTFVFGTLANIPTDGIPGPVFYFSALLPWTYFSSTLTGVSMSLVSNAGLLTKIYFPRIILPAAACLSGLVDFFIGSLFLAGFIIYYKMSVGWSLLLWPLLAIPLVLITFAAGSFLAALNVKYRDVKHAVPFAIQLGLFVTPVIYPTSLLPEAYRALLALNPLTAVIELFRYSLVPTQEIHVNAIVVSIAVLLVILPGGIWYFRRAERSFADIV
jgi:lipopolysaccharide transport system permease protein